MLKMTLLVSALSLMSLGTSQAATRPAKNKCNDAIRVLPSEQSRRYKGKDIGPTEAKDALRHYNQMLNDFKRTQEILAQVPKEDLDWKDPELKECYEKIMSLRSYVYELKPKVQAALAGSSDLEPFLAEVKPYKNSFMRMLAAHLMPSKNIFNGMKPEAAGQMRDEMAKVAELCSEKMPEAGGSAPVEAESYPPGTQYEPGPGVSFPKTLVHNADTWCWVAKNRDQLLSSAAGNAKVIVEGYGDGEALIPHMLKGFSADNAGMETWVASMLLDPAGYFAKADKASAAAAAKMGVASAGGNHAKLGALLKELQAKVDETAPQVKFRGGSAHDAAMEKDAIKQLKAIYPEAKIAATGMHADGWTITKNGLGVPLTRYRSGSLAFTLPGSKWCLQREFNWVETYSGGGSYEPPSKTSVLSGTQFLACP